MLSAYKYNTAIIEQDLHSLVYNGKIWAVLDASISARIPHLLPYKSTVFCISAGLSVNEITITKPVKQKRTPLTISNNTTGDTN